ncbi:MAG: glutamate--tRNA ligase [Rhizobiaceae bacterium]
MSRAVVTRFAPSPTGYLHIGGARTALFNWLFAKANGGSMLLRIEDTDRARSTEEAVEAIKDGLSWLGLEWDGNPISQHANASRHREVAGQMVDNGSAYRCYCTTEEVAAMREKARAKGHAPRYDGTCRERDPATMPEDAPFVVRLKAPLEGETIVQDRVQGTVRFPNKDLDDLVLLRSDGSPTYMLAVVVDDHDMNVTHIIRGDDHLTNAARQTLIFNGMGWELPVMAHIPLIHGPDGAKLSKRHGAIGAEAYRAMGYLPEALRNYLVRLGWSHGDDEIMSTDQMIEWFGFDGMNKAAARFDYAKLEAINSHYMREKPDEELLDNLTSVLGEIEGGNEIGDNLTEQRKDWLLKAMPSLKERAKTLVELARAARFLFEAIPLQMEDKASALLDEQAIAAITAIIPEFEKLDNWNHENIGQVIREFADANNMKLGKVAQPIRAALTGKASSPGAFDVLTILGREESLARLRDIM